MGHEHILNHLAVGHWPENNSSRSEAELQSVLVHVIRYSQPGTWEAYLGLHIQRKTSSNVVKKNLKQVISHPNYNPYTYDNDIALMELESPVTYSDYIRPICLPAAQHDFPSGNTVWITGWGATREGGESPKTSFVWIILVKTRSH